MHHHPWEVSVPVIALFCTHQSPLTGWELRHERRPTLSLCVCSPLMISLSFLSGTPKWQTRPEPSTVLILCTVVYVCIHADVLLYENEMHRLMCVCVCVCLGVSINEPRFHFRWVIIWLFIWLRFMMRPYICSLQHCSSL